MDEQARSFHKFSGLFLLGLGQAALWSSSQWGPSLAVRDCYHDFSVSAFFVHAVAIGLQLSTQVQWLTDVFFKLFLLGSFKVFLGHVKQLSSSFLLYFNCYLVKFSFKENRFLGGLSLSNLSSK